MKLDEDDDEFDEDGDVVVVGPVGCVIIADEEATPLLFF
jgi:hypothetical protein